VRISPQAPVLYGVNGADDSVFEPVIVALGELIVKDDSNEMGVATTFPSG
jgi:hypothetical protein